MLAAIQATDESLTTVRRCVLRPATVAVTTVACCRQKLAKPSERVVVLNIGITGLADAHRADFNQARQIARQ